ncbi:MAG: hypothetical protein K1Y36_02990 [Blastocatellia bacterium]|nr:hypothetical protein [Blastocatellia bacterium]
MLHSLGILLAFNARRRWNQGLRVLTGRSTETRRIQINPQMVLGVLVAGLIMLIIYSFTYATFRESFEGKASPFKTPLAAAATTLIHAALTLMSIGFEGINGFRFKQNLLHARTFPVPLRAIAWQSILETAVLSPLMLVFTPVLFAIARITGWGWYSWIPALVLPILLNYVSAHVQFWTQFVMHRWMLPSLLPFLNTLFTAGGLALILLLVPLMQGEKPTGLLRFLLNSGAVAWGPGGAGFKLVVQLTAFPALVLGAGLMVVTVASGLLLRISLKPGHVAAFLDSGTDIAHIRSALYLPSILKLFLRKPQILLQIFFPTVGIFSFLLVGDLFTLALKSAGAWGFFTFFLGLVAIVTSIPRLVIYEGMAFWRMYTYPRSVQGVLFRQAGVLAGLIILLSLGLEGFGLIKRRAFTSEDGLALALIGFGLPMATVICTCAAILGTWPGSSEKPPQLKPGVIAFGIVCCLMLPGAYFCPDWFKAGYLATFGFFTLGWWLAADQHVRYFLDMASHVQFDLARLNPLKRWGLMVMDPRETFADVVRAPNVIATLVCAICLSFGGNLLVEKLTPYTFPEIARERVEQRLLNKGLNSRNFAPADKKQVEIEVSIEIALHREIRYLKPLFVLPFQLFLIAGFFFVPCLVFEGLSRFSVYVSVVGHTFLAVSGIEYLAQILVLLLKKPELREMALNTFTATSLAFFAPVQTPYWILSILQEFNLFSFLFVVLAGYGLAVVNKIRMAALVPFGLWLVYLSGTALLEWVFG